MQHIPSVSDKDVERVAWRDFPRLLDQVREILSAYGRESFHQEIDRVRLAALKLAAGDIERLRREVESACDDYRDIILSSEYPEYGKKMFRIDRLPSDEKQKIIDSDRDQYETWLHRH